MPFGPEPTGISLDYNHLLTLSLRSLREVRPPAILVFATDTNQQEATDGQYLFHTASHQGGCATLSAEAVDPPGLPQGGASLTQWAL